MATIISEDTTWSGVMSISDDVQVAEGVTLTISAGSNISRDGYSGSVTVYGDLNIEGTEDSKSTINELPFTLQSGGIINANYTNFYNVDSFGYMPGQGQLVVTNSYFEDSMIRTYMITHGSNISGNTFNNSSIFTWFTIKNYNSILNLYEPALTINNNLFYGKQSSNSTEDISLKDTRGGVTINGNSFLNSGTAIISRDWAGTNAQNNWFNTTNQIEIDNKIKDSSDDLSYGDVDYSNFLSEPDPITPSIDDSFSGSLTGTSQNDQFDGLSGVLEINGLSGIDVVNYDLSTQEITFTSNDNQIAIQDSNSRQETLYNIERINFTDKSYALDLDGNAGIAAKIIIATFGSDSLNTYMSAALSLVDTGSSLDSLCDLVIQNGFIENAIGSTDITDFVTEIYTNAMGRVPTSLESAILTGYSDKGTHTKTDLLKLAANSSQVESQITENSVDLIGVAGNTDGEMLALLI